MIALYCNQALVWKRITARNDANEPTYASSTIKGRSQSGKQLVSLPNGQEVTAKRVVYTQTLVSVDDLIDDRQVVSVESMVSFDGKTTWYKVQTL